MEIGVFDILVAAKTVEESLSKSPVPAQKELSLLLEVLYAGMTDTSRLNFLEAHPCTAEVKGGEDDGLPLKSWTIATSGDGGIREAIDAYYEVTRQKNS